MESARAKMRREFHGETPGQRTEIYLQEHHDVYDGVTHREHTPQDADRSAVLQVGRLVVEVAVLRRHFAARWHHIVHFEIIRWSNWRSNKRRSGGLSTEAVHFEPKKIKERSR